MITYTQNASIYRQREETVYCETLIADSEACSSKQRPGEASQQYRCDLLGGGWVPPPSDWAGLRKH